MTINNWRLWLGIGVSVLFLVFLVWSIDREDLINALREANYLYVVPAVIIYFAGIYFRSFRWRYLLSPLRSIPARRLYPVVVIGYAANNVMPARIGELIRAYYLAQREQFSGSTALATIGVERIYDGLTLVTLGVASALLLLLLGEFGSAGSAYRMTALVISGATGVIFLAGLVVVTLLAVKPGAFRVIDRALALLPSRLRPKAREIARSFILGLSILRSPKQHAVVAFRSLPVWAAECAVYLTIAYSFGINDYFDSLWAFLLAIVLVTATSNLATGFPVSIGGIGPFELIAQQTLAGLGVDSSVAASYALVTHLVALWLPVNLAGFVLMWKNNLSFRQLTEGDEPTGEGGKPVSSAREDKI